MMATYDTHEIARIFGVHRGDIYTAIRSGHIKVIRVEGEPRIPRRELDRLLAEASILQQSAVPTRMEAPSSCNG